MLAQGLPGFLLSMQLATHARLCCPAEAVPKRILDAMNVEGLTRENVASHLQVRRDKRACGCAPGLHCSRQALAGRFFAACAGCRSAVLP